MCHGEPAPFKARRLPRGAPHLCAGGGSPRHHRGRGGRRRGPLFDGGRDLGGAFRGARRRSYHAKDGCGRLPDLLCLSLPVMDENQLFQAYRQTHDVRLRNEIAEKYLFIASMIAKKFVGRGVDYDDLFQVASLALLKGIDRFDETKGLKFSTFITPTITGEIKNYFRDRSRLIHLPRRVAELRVSVKKAEEELALATGKNPTAKEIAEKLNVPEEDVLSCMEAGSVVSLDRPVDGDSEEGASFYDMLPDGEDAFERIEQKDAVRRAIASLNETEKKLVSYRFGQELSQAETAKRMNVSQMYVSRMERKILQKLKEDLKQGAE
ncbi:MAG: B/F/G family RNA polymerase sigma-70 factor [Bacillota bacterium]|nr:MAG: B/F/G family RNA polymerase sigma-70 factor [Bacillota bacterium]